VKHGWSNNGRRGRDGGGDGKEIDIHPPEVTSNFSATVVPIVRVVDKDHGGQGEVVLPNEAGPIAGYRFLGRSS